MMRQRIPLVGSLTIREANGVVAANSDQRFINCFPIVTKNSITGKSALRLVKRRGYGLGYTLGSSASFDASIGYCVWSGFDDLTVFSQSDALGAKVEIYNSSGTIVGAQFAGVDCTSITETLISNVPTLVAFVYNSTSYTTQDAFYYQSGGAWTKIADAQFPGNNSLKTVGEPVHKDGYMFVMDEFGRIWNCDLNDLTAWAATSYIDASDSPDKGAGLALSGSYIAGFGRRSIQFFQNSGNATGSPLSRVPKTINLGVENIGSVYRAYLTVGDVTYFIGFNKEDAARGVYVLGGMEHKKISNTYVDELLNAGSYSYIHIVGTFNDHGQVHVLFRAAVITVIYLVYTPQIDQWWQFAPATTWSLAKAASGTSIIAGRSLYSTFSGSPVEGADNGTTFTMTAQTDPLDHGTNRKKFFTSAELICDSQTTSGDISISWSDDDYATFSTARTIDPSTGQKRITRLGATQRQHNNKRAWKITETVNRPFRGEAIDIEYEVGET